MPVMGVLVNLILYPVVVYNKVQCRPANRLLLGCHADPAGHMAGGVRLPLYKYTSPPLNLYKNIETVYTNTDLGVWG